MPLSTQTTFKRRSIDVIVFADADDDASRVVGLSGTYQVSKAVTNAGC